MKMINYEGSFGESKECYTEAHIVNIRKLRLILKGQRL